MNPDIRFVASAKPDSIHIVKTNHMQHSLFFSLVVFRIGYLTRFNQDIVGLWLCYLKYSESFVANFKDVFKFVLAQFAVERFPRVSGDVLAYFLVFDA